MFEKYFRFSYTIDSKIQKQMSSNSIKLTKREKYIHYITLFIVILFALYATIPMLVLRGNYIFTINDGLDSYAGMVEMIHDRHLYFHMNQEMPIMNGLHGKYFFMTYNLYDFLNCILGFLPGQICTRIIGVVLGFLSMQHLLKYLFVTQQDLIQTDLIYLISIAYAITPCAPNRTIAFSTLPFAIFLFAYLLRKEEFSYYSFWALLYPFFSIFDAVLVFVIGFWFLFSLVAWVKSKKFNRNLWLAFVFLCISTLVINFDFFRVALVAEETNRGLSNIVNKGFDWQLFKRYLLAGQYHSTGLHGYILLPFILIGSIYVFCQRSNNEDSTQKVKIYKGVLIGGYFFWIFSAFVETFQESGYVTGLLLIDGFQWGRVVGFMRIVWYIMLAVVVFSIPPVKTFKRIEIRGLVGVLIVICLMWGLSIYFKDTEYLIGNTFIDNTKGKLLMEYGRIILYIVFGIGTFILPSKKARYLVLCGILLLQLIYIAVGKETYNDTGYTVFYRTLNDCNDRTICFEEFFSEKLFDEIKKDIDYNDERVAAYGYHPSVLIYNGFITLDGYESVHTMEYQLQFREIIAPALERYPDWAKYYDEWGGRMYLYGSLSYEATRNKEVQPEPLYIDRDAFRKYGGKYILSRCLISNSEELGLIFVNDYDMEESLYHIYLYEVENS